jgi:hypothetical protein
MKIKWNIDTGYVNRIPDWELEIPDNELEGLSEQEQDNLIGEYVQEEMANYIYPYWKRVD